MLYLGPKITFLYIAKFLIYLAPRAGFEPATNRLTGAHSGVTSGNLPVHLVTRIALQHLLFPAISRDFTSHLTTFEISENVVTSLS